jgi:rsbT co-antagonist protein RsbR
MLVPLSALLSVVAVLALVMGVSFASLTHVQAASAEVINVSGRQRMLSQRSALLTLRLASSKDEQERRHVRERLRETIQLMTESHHRLTAPDSPLSGQFLSPEVQALYFEAPDAVDRRVADYIENVHTVLATPDEQLSLDTAAVWVVVQPAQEELLIYLDRVVQRYQADSERRVGVLRTLVFALIGVLLALVVAASWAGFLFARRIRLFESLATQIAHGKLTIDARLPAGADEIGRLGRAFAQLTTSLSQSQAAMVEQLRQTEEARAKAEAGGEQLAIQLTTIREQRDVIRRLSVPVLPVSDDTLVIPLVGALDGERLEQLQEQALSRLNSSRARRLVLDITGVPVIDLEVAGGLVQTMQAARLLGAQTVLVGVAPEVAQALASLQIDLRELQTAGDLQRAIVAQSVQ